MMMRRFAIALTFALLLTLFALGCASAEPVNATPLTLNQAATATISQAGGYAYFSFTPTESGAYTFYSVVPDEGEQRATFGDLYDANMTELSCVGKYMGYSFQIVCELTAGTPYYFGAHYWDSEYTGAFDVYLAKLTGLVSVSSVGGISEHLAQYGESVTLAVETVCTDESVSLSYRWTGSDGDIEGATQATYTIPNVTRTDTYWCHVTDEYGNTESAYFYVKVDNDLTISRVGDPTMSNSSRTVAPGGSVDLSVTASCRAGELTYRWYDPDWNVIEGATQATYTVPNVTSAGWYYCYVTDQYGNEANVNFYVRIDNQLTVQCVGDCERVVAPGDSVTMAVDVSCLDRTGLAYRWSGPDGEIAGATAATYTVQNIARAGGYYCYVTDQYDSWVSVGFYVTIDNHLTVQPMVGSYIMVAPGEAATLEVTVSCDDRDGLTYRWTGPEWNTIEGATGTSYTAAVNAAYSVYSCIVTDKYGNTASAYFSIYQSNQLRAERVGEYTKRVAPGGTATLEVEASCKVGTLSYQWYLERSDEDEMLDGQTGKTLVLNDIQSSGSYYCSVSDEYGSSTNVCYFVKINSGLYARCAGSCDVRVAMGGDATLTVDAGCDLGAVSYAWYVENDDYNYERIEGANGDSLTLNDVQQSGNYRCVASDSYGNSVDVNYRVWINKFRASRVGPEEIGARLGDNVTLTVYTSCAAGELSYEWRHQNNTIGGTMFNSLTLSNLAQADFGSYQCRVSDEYGNEQWIYFYIWRKSTVTVYAKTATNRSAAPGDSVTFQVGVESNDSNLTYQWRAYPTGNDNDGYEVIAGVTGDTYSFVATADSPRLCRCQVSNSKGEGDSIDFRLTLRSDTVPALTLDEAAQANIAVGGDSAFFSFTPDETGVYVFTSNAEHDDTCGYLYDSNWWLIQSNNGGDWGNNFKLVRELQAGETYYLGARYYRSSDTGGFPVTVSAAQDAFSTVTLSASPANPLVGEDFALIIETGSGFDDIDLFSVDDEGNRYFINEWYDDQFGRVVNYSLVYTTPQTLRFIAVGYGSGYEVESDLLTVDVTSIDTLAEPTVNVSANSDGVNIAYTMPALSNSMRVRVQAGNIRREFWASQSGTLTVPASKLSLGQVNVEVEATAFGAGYLASTTTASGSVFLHSANKMVLPSGLVSIDDEAFAGIPAEEFVIPSGCTTIGARAFADCDSLKLVVMPDSVTNISSSAFDGCEGVVFICQSNNAAANYARQHDNISYIIG